MTPHETVAEYLRLTGLALDEVARGPSQAILDLHACRQRIEAEYGSLKILKGVDSALLGAPEALIFRAHEMHLREARRIFSLAQAAFARLTEPGR